MRAIDATTAQLLEQRSRKYRRHALSHGARVMAMSAATGIAYAAFAHGWVNYIQHEDYITQLMNCETHFGFPEYNPEFQIGGQDNPMTTDLAVFCDNIRDDIERCVDRSYPHSIVVRPSSPLVGGWPFVSRPIVYQIMILRLAMDSSPVVHYVMRDRRGLFPVRIVGFIGNALVASGAIAMVTLIMIEVWNLLRRQAVVLGSPVVSDDVTVNRGQ